MDRDPESREFLEASFSGVPGPKLTRRVVLAGMGSALLVEGARATDTEDLQLFFADDQHEKIVISYGGVEWRWACKLFGEKARFRLFRESAVVALEDRPRTWEASAWTLTVENASFPGREAAPHQLTFRFTRDRSGVGALRPWQILLETSKWPAKADTARRFGVRNGPIISRCELSSFLMGPDGGEGLPCLEAELPPALVQPTLAGFFGLRVQADGPIVLGLDRTLAWRVAGNLYILDYPLRFAKLTIERNFGTDETATARLPRPAVPAGGPGPTQTAAHGRSPPPASWTLRRRLFAEEAPRQRADAKSGLQTPSSVGLYAEAGGPFLLPSRFELAFAGEGAGRVGATLAIDVPFKPENLRAGLRHWGRPEETVSGLVLEASGDRDGLRTLARLEISSGDPKAPTAPPTVFNLSAVTITRQQRPSDPTRPGPARVETRALLTPSTKEHVLVTPFGSVEARAAPMVSPRTALPARVPPIVIKAVDIDPQKEIRRLEDFEATLSMVSAGVRLPERAAGQDPAATERLGEHVTRLDFADAECRFVLPALGAAAVPVSADAVVPLGPDPAALSRGAHLGLDRAKLTVLRPTDLLSLSYHFSGLLLEIPRPSAVSRRPPARILPSRGGPVCRADSPAATQDGTRHPTRDERPVLAVEFPPQHVVERAYFRQIPTIDLPRLTDALKSDQDKIDLAKLREPKPRRGADPTGKHRKERQAARERLDPEVTALLMADLQSTKEEVKKQAQRHLDLRRDFKRRTTEAKLPKEQRIYLGPDFLDPDARRIALAILGPHAAEAALEAPDVELSAELKQAALAALNDGRDSKGEIDPTKPEHAAASDALELAKERRSGDYAEFRRAFRREHLKAKGKPEHATYRGRAWFKAVRDKLPARVADWTERFGKDATAPHEDFEELTEARLSGPSRLAFRINCDDFQAEHAGGGIPFSLEGLTDWGSFDLSVVRRAEKLPEAPARGPAQPRWARTYNLDDAEILAFQGIDAGDRFAIWDDTTLRGGRPSEPAPKEGEPFQFRASRRAPQERLAQVAASAREAPDPFQTAIELPFRLFLSPAQDGTWVTPSDAVRRKAFRKEDGDLVETCRELWSATLSGQGVEAGVRAVWSPDFRPAALLSTNDPGAPPHGPFAPWSLPRSLGVRTKPPERLEGLPRFRTSLDAYDRHELVVLSSLHGLPVLGRRDVNGEILGGSQFDPPAGYRLSNMRYDAPAKRRGSTETFDTTPRDYSAIYRPQPLAITELALTALGGNLNLDTSFTPPASARVDDGSPYGRNLFDAFSIERWRHRTVLGRDVLVEVVYKGFLFPIGHKATLVKITERRFEAVVPGGPPVSVLIQRKFLRVGEPVKAFPAYDHPNEGRRWPCERVTMLTRRTPDLIDPDDEAGELKILQVPGRTGQIFWPRTANVQGAEVGFQMLMDAESAPVTLPLMFVDNVAANDEKTMGLLVDWYNALDPLPKIGSPKNVARRRLKRNGQPVRMAPEAKPGDTSFETDLWDLKAEGRERGGVGQRDKDGKLQVPPTPKDPDNPTPEEAGFVAASFSVNNRRFDRDPFMEGLDQPAFYPLIDVARVRLTQVERFTGGAVTWASVAYDGSYVAKGFGETKKEGSDATLAPAGEVFLRLISGYADLGDPAPIKMRMASGDRSGGVGQPNLDVVGISRSTGPIGQAESAAPGAAKPATAAEGAGPGELPKDDETTKGTEDQRTSLPSISAHTANPTPEKVFPTDAKLLGLVPLADVLKVVGKRLLKEQPQLKEVVEYGASAAQGVGAEARALITQTVLKPIEDMLDQVDATWRDIAARNLDLGGGRSLSLGQAYPQIGASLTALRDAIAEALLPSTGDATFFGLLANVYEAGRALVAAIGRILRDPLASASEAQVAKLKGVVRDIQEVAKEIPAILKNLQDDVGAKLKDLLTDTLVDASTRAWRQALFALPLPDVPVAQALQAELAAAVDNALRKALMETLKDGFDLAGLPRRLAEELDLEAKQHQLAVARALESIAARVQEEAQARLEAIATPYLRQVGAALLRAETAARRIQHAVQADPAQVLETLRVVLVEILNLPAVILVDAEFVGRLKAADAACGGVAGQVVESFASLLGALLPPAASTDAAASRKVSDDLKLYGATTVGCSGVLPASPGTSGTISLGELSQAGLRAVVQLHVIECAFEKAGVAGYRIANTTALRIKLAEAMRPLAADIARLEGEMARVANWSGDAAKGCLVLPEEATRAVAAATAARERVLGELKKLVEILPAVRPALKDLLLGVEEKAEQDVKNALRAEVAKVTDALARAGLAATRIIRAGTLVATAWKDGSEGDLADSTVRKAKLDALVVALRAMAEALGSKENPQPDILAVIKALTEAGGEVERLDTAVRATAKGWRETIAAAADEAKLEDAIMALDNAVKSMPVLVDDIRKTVEEGIEREATKLVARLLVGAGATFAALESRLLPIVQPLVEALAKGLATLVTERVKLLNTLKGTGKPNEDPLLKSILAVVLGRLGDSLLLAPCPSPPAEGSPYKECTKFPDRLAFEADVFRRAKDELAGAGGLAGALSLVRPLIEAWSQGSPEPSLAVIVRQFASINADFARSLVLSAIDLKAIRREIDARIRDLVPARVVLPYDLDNELGAYPKDDAIFLPDPGTRLTLQARTVVHLLPGPSGELKSPEFSVTGEVGPFAVNLLGDAFDVVRIKFHGLSFQGGSGRSPDFRVRFNTVVMGEKAAFLQPLQDFLSPKAGGFYLKFLTERPGLEAGYGINLGVIGVGALSFSNVVLNAAARLPFDAGGEARFIISIGRSDAPFLISSTIFGGGGYLALIASSRSIVGFEASFDYGGVLAFGFGPLQGIGRVTMGIYLRREETPQGGVKTSLGATFFVGGSAHIACFGFSTSLLVRLVQNDGGPMYGEATYTFSFSLGIDDIEFSVQVRKNEGRTMGSAQQSAALERPDGGSSPSRLGRIRYAASTLQANDGPPLMSLAFRPGAAARERGEHLKVDGCSQSRDWAGFARYVDDRLRPVGARRRPGQ
ncbi:hypothetical protein ABS772_23495 [Methylorubrum podarium]|uniref:Uncharacterized protein n=1 Tax=Methylorubrum podarium TaxID=200476 RepID=A0ABV1QUC0_9HYPH